uniref:NB-ARC domain-containing protein n=1 Tax=Oryza glaberrima TaxID=4538 RepID=I1QSE2_ORYGL
QNLQKEVGGKKYLIVLDDVWNRDSDKWGKLKTCLKKGDMGSVVLTTTRDAEVARIMVTGEVQVHNLENIREDYLMEIVQSKAFSLAKSNEHFEVLRKIVQRCDGSPLAAKSFCSLLFNRTTV